MIYLAIDELLKKYNRSRYWLSKEIGTDFSTINKWVKNESIFIKLESIDKLCEAFHCEPKDLIKKK